MEQTFLKRKMGRSSRENKERKTARSRPLGPKGGGGNAWKRKLARKKKTNRTLLRQWSKDDLGVGDYRNGG